MQFDLQLSSSHPALPGHFPGAPVIPAVVLIERLAKSLEQLTGQPVTGIRQFRLLDLVAPGHRIDVVCKEKTPESWRLTCSIAGKPVAKGTFSSALPEDTAGMAEHEAEYQTAAAAYEQLPHAGAMELITEFGLTADGAQTRVMVTEGHPLADDNGLPAWATLEYAAQLMACRNIAMGGAPMSRAMIVLVRSLVRYTVNSVPVRAELSVDVTEEVAQPGAVQCAFTATQGNERIASGEFTVVSEG